MPRERRKRAPEGSGHKPGEDLYTIILDTMVAQTRASGSSLTDQATVASPSAVSHGVFANVVIGTSEASGVQISGITLPASSSVQISSSDTVTVTFTPYQGSTFTSSDSSKFTSSNNVVFTPSATVIFTTVDTGVNINVTSTEENTNRELHVITTSLNACANVRSEPPLTINDRVFSGGHAVDKSFPAFYLPDDDE
jgi:hypothetical protein